MDLTPERPPAPPDPNRDAGKLNPADYPAMELSPSPKGRKKGFQVVFRRSAIDAIHAHGATSLDKEICGVVVGQVHSDQRGAYLYIAAAIRGEHASHHAAQVTFTSDTWTAIHKVMDADYPDLRIVGWYHTHPDFGVFLSGMDLFIHDHFFDLPWQMALVYDPIGKDEGSFVWRAGQPKREPFLIHEAPGPWISPSTAATTSAGPSSDATSAPDISPIVSAADPSSDAGSATPHDASSHLDTSMDATGSSPHVAATDAAPDATTADSAAPAATATTTGQYWHLPRFRALRLFTRDLFRRQFRSSQNR